MKFSEEQYQQIIEEFENKGSYHKRFSLVMDVVNSFAGDYSYEEAFILGLPKSREWAHEQFVEEEKKYVWRLKSDNYLVISNLNGEWFLDKTPSDIEYFSEKEIENSPFKPDWFNKEEVE